MKTQTGRLGHLFLFIIAAVLTLQPEPATARILLKPPGQGALALRTKVLKADVDITGQFATTRMVMTFQNELRGWRPEVEFFYTAPPNTVVTYFAYWFQGEKVVARVVEKERAAAIYSNLTQWGRDPALIELVGKNTFRARIFPVFTGADLKIEMHTVQVLPSDRSDMVYEFPLREQQSALARPAGSWGTYEKLDLNMRVTPGSGLTRLLSNYHLPVRREHGNYHLRLSQLNYRPPMDLRVRLVRPPAALHAVMYAARSAGSDGFFALALTPDQALRKPVVRITGIATYQVIPTRLADVKAHQALTVYGRYKGRGTATVTLIGWTRAGRWTSRRPVRFLARRENNNLATKLWATRLIEHLSEREENRNRVVALSQRFTLPSRWTSWLAIPQAEMENFRRIKKTAEIEAAKQRLAWEIIQGRDRGATARHLRHRLTALTGRTAWRHGQDRRELHDSFWTIANNLTQQFMEEKFSPRPQPRRMVTLRRQLNSALKGINRDRGYGQPVTLDRHIAQQQKWWLDGKFGELASELVRQRNLDEPNAARMAALQREIAHLERLSGSSADPHIKGANYFWTREEMHRLAWTLVREQNGAQPNPRRVTSLRQRLEQLAKAAGVPQERFIDLARTNMANQWIAEVTAEINNAKAQERFADVSRWQKQQAELEQRFADVRGRYGDPLISIEAPEDAEQVIALMPGGEVKKLVFNADSRKWEARFDIPTYANEGAYSITVIVVRKDGTRQQLVLRYHVDLTAPVGTGQAQVAVVGKPTLRLELNGSDDTARVFALLPWGEKVELKPSTVEEHRFFALVPVPSTHRGAVTGISYVLTDKAHNRTTVTVDVSK